MALDRVQVIKQESADLGGNAADDLDFPTPIDPQTDALESAGLYLQDATNRDLKVLLSRNGDDLLFKDGKNTTALALSDLAKKTDVPTGVNATAHEFIATLTHSYVNNGWEQIVRNGSGKITSVVIWADATMTLKRREKIVLRDVDGKITGLEYKQYDDLGNLLVRLIKNLNKNGSGVTESVEIIRDQIAAIPDPGGGGGSPPGPIPPPSTVDLQPYNCPPTAQVGDVVYLSGSDTVGLALASSIITMPAFGVVVEKTTATTAKILCTGDANFYSGLTPKTLYFVSDTQPGKVQAIPPDTAGTVVQKVGIARNNSSLVLILDVSDIVVQG